MAETIAATAQSRFTGIADLISKTAFVAHSFWASSPRIASGLILDDHCTLSIDQPNKRQRYAPQNHHEWTV
ncbi:MAG TPA: hypothetical protein DEF45_02510 [Rhodopirellula sp.]|nr:hypothetical protein [Rhodopirellula sp.]